MNQQNAATRAPNPRPARPRASADLALDLSHVAKVYRGKVRALTDVAMHVRRGEIFGLLGPNGAGKSTLVKILMTVIRPTRCEGTLLGRPVGDKPTLARVGYLPEHNRFPEYLTGAQVLDHFGALAGVDRATRKRRAGELLELVGMSEWAHKRIRTYSKGMRQRTGVAQALINDPDLVVLDEPTDGVDPVGRRDIRNVVSHIRDRGRTVFLNSHLLSELEMVCDRVAILVQGTVRSHGTLDELTTEKQRYEIQLTDTLPADAATTLAAIMQSGEHVEVDGATVSIATTDADAVQPVIAELIRRGAVIRSLRPVRPSLEDLFMDAVTDPSTGRAAPPGAPSGAKPKKRAVAKGGAS